MEVNIWGDSAPKRQADPKEKERFLTVNRRNHASVIAGTFMMIAAIAIGTVALSSSDRPTAPVAVEVPATPSPK